MGAELLSCGAGPRVDLSQLLSQLGRRRYALFSSRGSKFSFLAEGLTDKVTALAPKILGGRTALRRWQERIFHLKDAVTLTELQVERLGTIWS